MRQILYISTAREPGGAQPAEPILAQSQRNNAREGVTGLLFVDGRRFLQALEGDPSAVTRTLSRIEADSRHRAIVILSDRIVDAREFGEWAMAWRYPGNDAEDLIERVAALVAGASPGVRSTFTGFADVRRAA